MVSNDNRLIPTGPLADRNLDRPLSDIVAQSRPYGYSTMNEPTHLRDYLAVVVKRKWLILSLVLVVTSLVTIQMYRLPSIYEAKTTLQIEQKRESILKTGNEIIINPGNIKDPNYLGTQLRLLESPALARQVIITLDLQNNPAFFEGQANRGLFGSLRRIFSRQKPAQATATNEAGSIPVVRETEVKGQQWTPEQLAQLEPYEDAIISNLTVEPVLQTNHVTLRYRHTNPELAQKIVNTLADVFVFNNFDRETSGTKQAQELLAQKIAELQLTIRQQEEQRFNYATRNNLPQTDAPNANLLADRLAMLSKQLLDAENDRKNYQSLYEAAANASDPNSIPEVGENERIQELRAKLDALKQRRSELSVIYTPEWPEVKKINEQIKPIEEALEKAPREVIASLKSRYEAALAKERKLAETYNQLRGETSQQNLAQIQLSVLKQDLETNKQEYNTLRQRQRELENTQADKQNNMSVPDYGRVPKTPVGPARMRNILIAFLLSLGAGIGLAFLLDYLDDTLKSIEDVDRYIHLPALALIPANRVERPRLKGKRSAAPEPGEPTTALALTSDVRSPIAESYRHLRTSLLLSSAGQPPRSILITSSQPSEGKTTTAINTAIALAQTGAEVLIIDCDLRRPRVHTNFSMSNARGVTNYLSGDRELETLVQSYDKLPNLKVMTSGPIPPNPAELLGSQEMRNMLKMLSERYTHIIIDSPPAISFTDASILSTMVDGVVLVVHGGRSSRAIVRRAKQQLLDVGANIFGIVLNNVKLESTNYYYYSGYYSSYYENDDGPDVPDSASGARAS